MDRDDSLSDYVGDSDYLGDADFLDGDDEGSEDALVAPSALVERMAPEAPTPEAPAPEAPTPEAPTPEAVSTTSRAAGEPGPGPEGRPSRPPASPPPAMRFVAYREMLRGWRPKPKPRRAPRPLLSAEELQMASSIASLAVVMIVVGALGAVLMGYLLE